MTKQFFTLIEPDTKCPIKGVTRARQLIAEAQTRNNWHMFEKTQSHERDPFVIVIENGGETARVTGVYYNTDQSGSTLYTPSEFEKVAQSLENVQTWQDRAHRSRNRFLGTAAVLAGVVVGGGALLGLQRYEVSQTREYAASIAQTLKSANQDIAEGRQGLEVYVTNARKMAETAKEAKALVDQGKATLDAASAGIEKTNAEYETLKPKLDRADKITQDTIKRGAASQYAYDINRNSPDTLRGLGRKYLTFSATLRDPAEKIAKGAKELSAAVVKLNDFYTSAFPLQRNYLEVILGSDARYPNCTDDLAALANTYVHIGKPNQPNVHIVDGDIQLTAGSLVEAQNLGYTELGFPKNPKMLNRFEECVKPLLHDIGSGKYILQVNPRD